MISIRPEHYDDLLAIHFVIEQAFGRKAEADLVDKLRANGKVLVSLVAIENNKIIGHILFSLVTLGAVKTVGLAPLAVLPSAQNRGVGAMLTEAGIAACRALGYAAMIVLGHPEYYPRFGFVPASQFGIKSEYDVPDEVFMALELQPKALANCGGIAKYQPEFNDL